MPFNGSGIYNLPVTTVTPAVSGTTIDDSEFNTFTADLKDALTNCIVKDGQTVSPTLTSPSITSPSIVSPTISGSPVFTGNVIIDKAEPRLILTPTDETLQNTLIEFWDELSNGRAFIYRPTNQDRLRLDARNAAGVAQAALEITEAGGVDVATGTFSATSAALTSPIINTGVSGTAGVSRMIQDTVQATTSGTSKDFTVPSWAKKITIPFDQVSTSSAGFVLFIRIGTSSTPDTTGYESSASIISSSAATLSSSTIGFYLCDLVPAAEYVSGVATIVNTTGNVWEISGTAHNPASGAANRQFSFAGRKTLSGAIDIVRFASGGTFDNGQVNAVFEG